MLSTRRPGTFGTARDGPGCLLSNRIGLSTRVRMHYAAIGNTFAPPARVVYYLRRAGYWVTSKPKVDNWRHPLTWCYDKHVRWIWIMKGRKLRKLRWGLTRHRVSHNAYPRLFLLGAPELHLPTSFILWQAVHHAEAEVRMSQSMSKIGIAFTDDAAEYFLHKSECRSPLEYNQYSFVNISK